MNRCCKSFKHLLKVMKEGKDDFFAKRETKDIPKGKGQALGAKVLAQIEEMKQRLCGPMK